MRSAVLCVVVTLALYASAAEPVPYALWEASSGLTPDQVGYELIDESSPEDPILSSSALILGNDVMSERLFYRRAGADLFLGDTIEVAFRMRFVNGASSYSGRAPAVVALTTAPYTGVGLYIGMDVIFLTVPDFTQRGPENTTLDTDSSFHDYRISIDGTAAGSAVSVFQDDILVLSGVTHNGESQVGDIANVRFGEESIYAYGTSEWQSFAIIPEPAAFSLLGLGSLALVMLRPKRQR